MLMFYLLNCMAKVGPGAPLVEEKGTEVNSDFLDFSIRNEQKARSIIESAPRSEQSKIIRELISTKEGTDFFIANSLECLVMNNLGDDLELIKELVDKGKLKIFHSCIRSSRHLSIDVVNYVFDEFAYSDDLTAKCLYCLIENEKISQEKKAELVDKVLDREILHIHKCNEEGILGLAIQELGNNPELIEKFKRRGITRFGFCWRIQACKYLDIELIEYIFSNIEQDKIEDGLYHLISNKKISQEKKAELVNKVLDMELNIEKCNKKHILLLAEKHLGNNLELIEKMKRKGITRFGFIESINKDDNIIPKEEKADLILKILKNFGIL